METTNIYVLIDPETNKVRYVGKANNVKQRYNAHLNKAREHQTHKKNWINSLRGKKLKPIIEIIDIVPISEWVFWESYWISQFKTWGFDLVNHTYGGNGSTFGNITSFKNGHNSKPIVALNKNGKFVCEFKNVKEGELFCGKKCVDNALLKNLKSAGGYLWLYKKEYENLNENELKEFVKWANDKKCKPNSGSFKKGNKPWIKNKKMDENFKNKIKKTRTCKPVLQYDLEDNFIMEHRSLEDAAKYVNGHATYISAVCKNKKHHKTYKKYKWKFKK